MQRRSFLQNILWLTGGLIAGCNKHFRQATGTSTGISGKVVSDGNALAGVVVSDGFNAVQTTKNGTYELPLNNKAEHLFVSIPAGYAFPHEKNIASHYRVLQPGGKLDFELEKLTTEDDKHQFIIWADPQVKNQSDVQKMMTQSVPDVQQYVKGLPADTLIHGVCVGDLVWDALPLFASYNKAIEQCGMPFFQVIGNHDMDYRKGADDTSDDTFKKHYGPSYYSFNRGKVHYVVLDDVYYLGTERDYKGYITEEQLSWLKQDLSFVGDDKLVVVCLHIPVHKGVENNQALYDILKPYKVHIMSGHTHYNNNIVRDNVYEHVHGTVCGAWWTGPICGDGTPPGYAIYEVNGTDLTWYYKSTGFDHNHQIRASVEDNSKGEKELCANIWNWDPLWKVEWYADGVSKGTLNNMVDFDPMAVLLYQGDKLPNPRPFVEPHKTDHIFKAIVPAGTKQVKITATDRFKNVYELTV